MRASGQGRKVFYLSVFTGITMMIGALGGGAIGGARGAAWGYAVSETATVALWWATLAMTRSVPSASFASLTQQVAIR